MTAQVKNNPIASTGTGMAGLSWIAILRLGLVQAALGSIVVLTTSTLNRVMVVELALAATIPGMLVGLHYGVQISRPLWGHGSDRGGNRSRWVLMGLGVLALAGTGAAATTLLFEQSFIWGLIAAIISFTLIGLGIGASGTSLLALLASRTAPARRPAAATVVWMMMIAGIIVTAIVSGTYLDPYSHIRLISVTAITGLIAFAIAALALFGIEKNSRVVGSREEKSQLSFKESLADTLGDPQARLFTIFVFFSMLAYSTQDLILEPFAGMLFGMTPGETTKLSGVQHGGVFLGMAMVGIVGSLLAHRKPHILKFFTISGCLLSGAALGLLALSAFAAPLWPLKVNIFLLGVANGAFAVAAIGTMMALAGQGNKSREGIRMGVWGAAQAIAFGLGGVMGTIAIDVSRYLTGDVPLSFAIVFSAEATLFIISALIAFRIGTPGTNPSRNQPYATMQPAE